MHSTSSTFTTVWQIYKCGGLGITCSEIRCCQVYLPASMSVCLFVSRFVCVSLCLKISLNVCQSKILWILYYSPTHSDSVHFFNALYLSILTILFTFAFRMQNSVYFKLNWLSRISSAWRPLLLFSAISTLKLSALLADCTTAPLLQTTVDYA